MKKLLSALVILFMFSSLFGQTWTDNLAKQKDNNKLSFYDYQNAFNAYWDDYNVEQGYYIDKNGDKQKASGWKQFKRWEYYWETQVDLKTGMFPNHSALDVYKNFAKTAEKLSKEGSGEWISMGPNSSEGGYAGVGRINCIGYHPTDNNTYWVGTASGGLWVTYDNAATWEVLTDQNSVLGISDIAIPADYETSKTIYIATGDRDHWDNLSVGVLKSTDAGATWESTGISFMQSEEKMTTRILLDPNDSKTLVAATSVGVFRTTDGGTTWNEELTNLSFIDMEYKPGDFNTLYGSTETGKIYQSADGGVNWTISHNIGNRIELAVTPADSARVYAVVVDDNNGLKGVYRSTNSGVSFNLVFYTKNLLHSSTTGVGLGGQGWYDLAIAASPINADILTVGGINTWISTNGGYTFNISNHWVGSSTIQAVHADKHMLSYRANGDLFECNDGGLYVFTNTGTKWIDKTDGITHSQIYKLGVSQHSDNQVLVGLQDNGTKHHDNTTWSDVLGGDGMECFIDYTNEKIQFGTQQRGVLKRTTDGWKTAYTITPEGIGSGAWVTPFIIDPVNPSTIYAAYADVWKSTNKGYSWSKISSINISTYIRSLAVAPSNSLFLYASSLDFIYKTTDGGVTWTNITGGLPSNFITYITVSKDNPEMVWVTLGGYDSKGVYQSVDGGDSWTNISNGLPEIPVNCVVQDTSFFEINVLYAGTEVGVYVKVGDENWKEYNNGLPNVKIGEIEIYYDKVDSSKSRLVAATYGRGLWKTPLISSVIGDIELLGVDAITETGAMAHAKITNGDENTIETGFIFSPFSNAKLGDKYTKTVTTNPLIFNDEFSLALSELSNSTYYYIKAYIKSIYGTNYSEEIAFVTACGATVTTFPVVQEFSVDSLPACWNTYDNFGTNMSWVFDNPASVTLNSTTGSNGIATANSEYYGEGKVQDAVLNTVHFDFTNYEYVNLIFEHNAPLSAGAVASFSGKNETLGNNWELIQDWTDSIGSNGDAGYFVKDLSELAAGHSDVVFEWVFKSANAGYWAIDDLLIDTLHAVLIKVINKDGMPVNNAEVLLGKTALTTNFSGEVLFKSVSNTTLNYSVSKEGYIAQTSSLQMNHSNIFLDIILQKIPSSNAILADITLDGTTIEGFERGKLNYTVTVYDDEKIPIVAAVAEDKNAKVAVSQATVQSPAALIISTAEDKTKMYYNINFTILPALTYNVTFNVANSNSEAIADAVVNFEGKTESTNTDGTAILENVNKVKVGNFTITKAGFAEYSDTLSVIDKNVEVQVVLNTVGVNDNNLLDAYIYPNPVNDLLYYSLKNENESASVKIYNVLGKLMLDANLTNSKGSIDVKHFEPGVYMVSILAGNQVFSKRIVKE